MINKIPQKGDIKAQSEKIKNLQNDNSCKPDTNKHLKNNFHVLSKWSRNIINVQFLRLLDNIQPSLLGFLMLLDLLMLLLRFPDAKPYTSRHSNKNTCNDDVGNPAWDGYECL